MAFSAGAAAAAAGGVGLGLFNYNRGNYMVDQKLHYARFCASHTLAVAQAGQYRQDISDLTSLTVGRVHIFADLAAMTATILTALYCPGRLGLHTSPPPGWLMGLMMVNLAGCYVFLGLTIWLGIHASLRADSAATHMLTRFVRLPVPAQWMLDRARKFLSSWEEQPLREVFRIPFLRHQRKSRGAEGGYNEGMEVEGDAASRMRKGYDVPAWYRKEKAVASANTLEAMMPYTARGAAPEHFEVFREIQQEWWPYDVYCRLSIFLAFMHLAHCWTYMQIGHQLQETRAIFAAGCVVIAMSMLQQIILTLDIIPTGDFPIHRIGPFAQFLGWIAACIEYRPFYSQGVANIGYILVFLAYAIHIVYTLQLLRICAPDFSKPPEAAEAPSASWWPAEWRLPSSFVHAVWLVAPPLALEPGQNDIVGELRDFSMGNAVKKLTGWGGLEAHSLQAKRRDVHRAMGKQGESPAWWNVKMGLYAMVAAWIFLTIGFGYEVLTQGTSHPSLLNAPGMPNNFRDPRYRPAKPFHNEPTEVGTGGAFHGPATGLHEGAVERRLSQSNVGAAELAQKLHSLLPVLKDLAAVHEKGGLTATRSISGVLPVSKNVATKMDVRWPALFAPRVMACANQIAASAGQVALTISQHGRGTVISEKQVSSFSLEGAMGFGPLVAAWWDEFGLLLMTATGKAIECPGTGPVAGRWSCRPSTGEELPLSDGTFEGAVALTRLPRQTPAEALQLKAAVVFPGESSVTVFTQTASSKSWLPAGEVHTYAPVVSAAFTSTAEQLLLTFADGAVAKLDMSTGNMVTVVGAAEATKQSWQATCGLPTGAVAQLALDEQTLTPVLYMS